MTVFVVLYMSQFCPGLHHTSALTQPCRNDFTSRPDAPDYSSFAASEGWAFAMDISFIRLLVGGVYLSASNLQGIFNDDL
jgi:hypothetical protein